MEKKGNFFKHKTMPGTLDIQPFIYEKNFEWWIRSFFYLKSVHFVNALFFWTISFFTRFLQFKFFSTNLPQAFVVTDFRLKMFAASNFDEWTILITFICDFSKSIGKSSTTCKRKFYWKKKKNCHFFLRQLKMFCTVSCLFFIKSKNASVPFWIYHHFFGLSECFCLRSKIIYHFFSAECVLCIQFSSYQ